VNKEDDMEMGEKDKKEMEMGEKGVKSLVD